ncbi:unnamed protein product [Ectocarpus sp. 8 AP-2014]
MRYSGGGLLRMLADWQRIFPSQDRRRGRSANEANGCSKLFLSTFNISCTCGTIGTQTCMLTCPSTGK